MPRLFDRTIKDANLIVTKAPPAAGASNQTNSIDLGHLGGVGVPAEGACLLINIPAMAALADAKKLTIKLQDSADNSSFADVDPLISTFVIGAGGAGCAAKEVEFPLPSTVRRYIRCDQTEEAAGGDITGSTVTYSLLV